MYNSLFGDFVCIVYDTYISCFTLVRMNPNIYDEAELIGEVKHRDENKG